MDKLLLRSTESSPVGDIVDSVIGLRVLTVDTSDLDEVLIGDLLELLLLFTEFLKLNVDGSSEGGTEIGWARGDVTEMVIMGELADSLDVRGGSAESVEDLEDTSSLLHGDDSELILLVNPDEESLGIVMEDSSSLWPVSLESARLKILVTSLEEEMISDELLSLGIGHLWEGVVLTLEITSESRES